MRLSKYFIAPEVNLTLFLEALANILSRAVESARHNPWE